MNYIFLKVACLCVGSLIYSMESQGLFEHQITSQTYDQFQKLPLLVQQDILNQSASMWNKEGFYFLDILQKNILIKHRVSFTPDEINRRYPWGKQDGILSTSISYHGKKVHSINDFSLAAQESVYEIVGPNKHKRVILYGQIEDLNPKIEEQEDPENAGFFGRLRKRFKQDAVDPVIIPGQPLALHPYKNICLFAHEFKGLYLYDLDTHKQLKLSGFEELTVNENNPVLAEFGTGDRLFIANRGSLYVYSLCDHKLIDSINSKKLIGEDALFTRDFLDAERRKQTTVAHDKGETCTYLAQIEDFDYSFEYAQYVLCKVALFYYKENIRGDVIVKSAVPLEHFRFQQMYYVLYDLHFGRSHLLAFPHSQKLVQLMWDSSIEIYRLRSLSEWLGNRIETRDTVSLFSWNVEDLKAYILTAAAHQWLNNKEKNLNEARSIFSHLYHSKNRYKLLWQSTYLDELGQRRNPFRDIFDTIKKIQHTHNRCDLKL